jgi:hypothetical protein
MTEIVVCPELAYLLDAAMDVSHSSHCNVTGMRYIERREAYGRLRGAVIAYHRRLLEEPEREAVPA